jgi:hypothetical protein
LRGVPIQLNQAATVNITRSPGAVATTVEVNEVATIIDTTTAQIQSNYSARQIADPPTNTDTSARQQTIAVLPHRRRSDLLGHLQHFGKAIVILE